MKKILGLALAGALSVAALPAVTADYPLKAPPPPIWTWTGFYLGVEAGGGWNHQRWSNSVGNVIFDFQGTGGLAGVTLGYNWQAPGSPWVIGVEGDWSWTSFKGQAAPTAPVICGTTCVERVNWLATLRGRLGHANGPLLFYVTGGAAFAEIHSFFAPPIGPTGGNTTSTKTGWAVGAGLEGNLGGGWSLKGEYIYAAFGATGVCVPGDGSCAVTVQSDYNRVHMLRAGVNYRFGTF